MLDAKEMETRCQAGMKLIEGLPTQEKELLQAYCGLYGDTVLQAAVTSNAPMDEVAANAVRIGMALGLQLSIENGQFVGRK